MPRSHFVLEVQGSDGPVSYSAFNASLPEIVQVGGVWTPPEQRGRGYARAVVAGSLLDARAERVVRAVLFTENPAARRAYEALGFQRVGEYGLGDFQDVGLLFLIRLLPHREALLSIESGERLRLHELEAGPRNAREQVHDLGLADGSARLRQETAAALVDAEGLRSPVGPHLDAAARQHRQLEAGGGEGFELRGQRIRVGVAPANIDVDADRLLFREGLLYLRLRGLGPRSPAVGDRLQRLGFLAEAADDGLGKLLRAELLLRDALLVDVVGVGAVLLGPSHALCTRSAMSGLS